jgi:hypothetical protein
MVRGRICLFVARFEQQTLLYLNNKQNQLVSLLNQDSSDGLDYTVN